MLSVFVQWLGTFGKMLHHLSISYMELGREGGGVFFNEIFHQKCIYENRMCKFSEIYNCPTIVWLGTKNHIFFVLYFPSKNDDEKWTRGIDAGFWELAYFKRCTLAHFIHKNFDKGGTTVTDWEGHKLVSQKTWAPLLWHERSQASFLFKI